MDTVEPLYKGHVGDRPFVPWREVGSEVIMYYHYLDLTRYGGYAVKLHVRPCYW